MVNESLGRGGTEPTKHNVLSYFGSLDTCTLKMDCSLVELFSSYDLSNIGKLQGSSFSAEWNIG